MPPPHLTRRQVLRAAGVALALPWLESLAPRLGAADPPRLADPLAKQPARLVCVYWPHGPCNEQWYPATAGAGWQPSPSLAPLAAMQRRLTLISGLSHAHNPEGGGHEGADVWLTGYHPPHPAISLDQVVAGHWSGATRFTSLQLGNKDGIGTRNRIQTLSFNQIGVPLPAISNPRLVFARLFTADTAEARRAEAERLARDASVLDAVSDQTAATAKLVSAGDRRRIDEYLEAVRAVEQQIAREKLWLDKPKPKIEVAEGALDLTASARAHRGKWMGVMYELMALALQSDSTRVITWMTNGEGATSGPWPEHGGGIHHSLQHHGGDAATLARLAAIDLRQSELFATFLARLAEIREGEGSLLDRTVVLYGSGMNNGLGFKNGSGSHGTRSLATIVAGGDRLGLKHGQHLRFPAGSQPLANVHYSIQKALGVPGERFADSTGILAGLL